MIIGVSSSMLIYLLKFLKRKFSEKEELPAWSRKIFWFVGTARNAIVVILFTLISLGVNFETVDEWKGHGFDILSRLYID